MQETEAKNANHWRDPNTYLRLLILLIMGVFAAAVIPEIRTIEKNAIANSRAFVLILNAPQVSLVRTENDPTTWYIQVVPHIVNTGSTPTADLKVLVRCIPANYALPDPWAFLHQGDEKSTPQVIGPRADINVPCAFGGDDIEQMSLERAFGYVLGDISYHDRIDNTVLHRTEFEWAIDNKTLKIGRDADRNVVAVLVTGQNVGAHNCIDDECPKD